MHTHNLLTQYLQSQGQTLSSDCGSSLPQSLLDQLNWCSKCQKYESRVRSLEDLKQFNLLGGLYTNQLHLQCKRRGHHYSISYSKKLEHICCQTCKQQDFELHKELLRKQELLEAEKSRKKQEILFAQARQKMMQQDSSSQSSCCQSCRHLLSQCQCKTQSNMSDLASFEQKINKQASQQAKEYLNSQGLSSSEFTKNFLIYKFNGTPLDIIVKGLKAMGDLNASKSFFKKIALQVHPDKNSHPLAKDVF